MATFSNIPTNIISGFLGSGKTTAIQYLLTQKPTEENWAVIVNEFGKVGIDGVLLKKDAVTIQEIPGGCLCCVGSQALSVGLNKIIRTLKPQRIIIEPTGLGHPLKLVKTLTGEFYESVLDLKAIINLVDARHLNDQRYTENENFIDQSNLADILVASKLDTYSEVDKQNFYRYVASFTPQKAKTYMVEAGRLPIDFLDIPRGENRLAAFPHSHTPNDHSNSCPAPEMTDLQKHWLIIEGHANGFYSIGWKINNEIKFNREKTIAYLKALFENKAIERVKSVLRMSDGWVSLNFTPGEQQISESDMNEYSILEIVTSQSMDTNTLDSTLKSLVS